jgi:hypothetical protein
MSPLTCTATQCAGAPDARERQNHDPTSGNCFSTITGPNCMQITEMAHRINATKLYYLNLLRRLMLRPLLVTLGGDTGVSSEPTPPPPTPDARLLGCLIACFLEGLFGPDLKACFLFFGGGGTGLASSLSLPLSQLLGLIFFLLLPSVSVHLPLLSCCLLQGKSVYFGCLSCSL